VVGQSPAKTDLSSTAEVVADSGRADPDQGRNLALAQPAGVVKTKTFFNLAHR
jgi:hypothetical protein